ncbi:TIGR03086 family metal-binding protein [Actinomycetota bacterium Odt1-20B]
MAVEESLRLLAAARGDDWDRPTPCAGWTLRRLVAHMTAQHHGFAAAARGSGADRTYWFEPDLSREYGQDPLKIYEESVRHVLAAFAEDGVPERLFVLPDFGASFPGRIAVGFHFLDYAVHAWDVAVTVGGELRLADDVVEAALAVALRVPTDPERRGPGAAFAPPRQLPDDGGPLARMLAHLGRDPHHGRNPTAH